MTLLTLVPQLHRLATAQLPVAPPLMALLVVVLAIVLTVVLMALPQEHLACLPPLLLASSQPSAPPPLAKQLPLPQPLHVAQAPSTPPLLPVNVHDHQGRRRQQNHAGEQAAAGCYHADRSQHCLQYRPVHPSC